MSQPIEVDEIPSTSDDPQKAEGDPRISSEPAASEHSRNSTKSLSATALEVYFEHNRRYCSPTYYLPADDSEQTRLSILHQVYLSLLDSRLTLSHIPPNATRILDIGTGPADWAISIAELHPSAEVTATDITTAFQPAIAPPNLFFELDDADQEWAYAEAFDFIHMRGLAGAFTDWERLFGQVAKYLRSSDAGAGGGTFELADISPITHPPGHPCPHTQTYNRLLLLASHRSSRPLTLTHLSPPYTALNNAGLTVIKAKTFDVPLGPWPGLEPQKRVAAKMALIAVLEGLEAGALRLLGRWGRGGEEGEGEGGGGGGEGRKEGGGKGGWSEEEVKALCEKVRGEVVAGRAFVRCRIVVARKLGV